MGGHRVVCLPGYPAANFVGRLLLLYGRASSDRAAVRSACRSGTPDCPAPHRSFLFVSTSLTDRGFWPGPGTTQAQPIKSGVSDVTAHGAQMAVHGRGKDGLNSQSKVGGGKCRSQVLDSKHKKGTKGSKHAGGSRDGSDDAPRQPAPATRRVVPIIEA